MSFDAEWMVNAATEPDSAVTLASHSLQRGLGKL